MAERRVFVFRQETSNPDDRAMLFEEIKGGRLRQGWGISHLDLRQDAAQWVRHFVEEGKKAWHCDLADSDGEARYWILQPMLTMKPGDVLLVPKQPTSDGFLLLLASDAHGDIYTFDNRKEEDRGMLGDDFRHVVHIDSNRIRECTYRGNIHSLAIRSSIIGYQRALNNVVSDKFKIAVERLLERKVAESLPTLRDVVRTEAVQPVFQEMLNTVRKLPPPDLEELIEGLFIKAGFEVISRNRFDRKGGDIDRTFQYALTVPSLMKEICPEEPAVTLHIQVKQKTGVDCHDRKGVEQLRAMKTDSPNQYAILISTVDHFTPECIQLAADAGVILIDGSKLAEIILRHL